MSVSITNNAHPLNTQSLQAGLPKLEQQNVPANITASSAAKDDNSGPAVQSKFGTPPPAPESGKGDLINKTDSGASMDAQAQQIGKQSTLAEQGMQQMANTGQAVPTQRLSLLG